MVADSEPKHLKVLSISTLVNCDRTLMKNRNTVSG